jgi:hypothetical protein
MDLITQEEFQAALRKAIEGLKEAATSIHCERIRCELTDAYLYVTGDPSDMLFRVNIASRFEFVARMINKKCIEFQAQGL